MRGGLDGGSRGGNGGRMPLSWVNTEWKYSLRSSALFSSDVSMEPSGLSKGAIPDLLPNFPFTNL